MSLDLDCGGCRLKSSLTDVCSSKSIRASWSVAAICSQTRSVMCESVNCIRISATQQESFFFIEIKSLTFAWQWRCIFTYRRRNIYPILHFDGKSLGIIIFCFLQSHRRLYTSVFKDWSWPVNWPSCLESVECSFNQLPWLINLWKINHLVQWFPTLLAVYRLHTSSELWTVASKRDSPFKTKVINSYIQSSSLIENTDHVL